MLRNLPVRSHRLARRFGGTTLALLCALACSTGSDPTGGGGGGGNTNDVVGGQNNGTTTTPGGATNANNTVGGVTPGNGQGTDGNGVTPEPGTQTNPNATDGNTPAVGGGNLAAAVRFVGRVPSQGAHVLSWAGSAAEVAFVGTQGNVTLTAASGNNVVATYLDGVRVATTPVGAATTLPFGPVASGNHTVRVVKTSEPRLGTVTLGTVSSDGALQATQAPTRAIEFIGDSITVGYGINGNAPCTNTAALEDASKSFASLAADALAAEASLVAWAGKGLVRNDTSDNSNAPVLLPALWQRTVATDAASSYDAAGTRTPQLVVMALGTNDFEYMEASAQGNLVAVRPAIDHNAFVAAYVSFVQQVAARYPSASFVLCTSPLLSDYYPVAADAQHTALLNDLQAVATQVGASKVSVLDFVTLTDAQRTGCGAHPSAAAQQAMATQLATFVRQKLGW